MPVATDNFMTPTRYDRSLFRLNEGPSRKRAPAAWRRGESSGMPLDPPTARIAWCDMGDDVVKRLRAGAAPALQPTPVRFAFLFGSRARGEGTSRSDVDVAVSIGDHSGDRTSLVLDAARRLHRHTGLECDVLVLEDVTLRLLHRILHDGVLIYDADPVARVEYVATTRKLASDYAIHADKVDRELLRAVGAGSR